MGKDTPEVQKEMMTEEQAFSNIKNWPLPLVLPATLIVLMRLYEVRFVVG